MCSWSAFTLVHCILLVTSMYPAHSGAIGLSNLEHFLTLLMGISSATLSFSLPLFLRKKMIHIIFITLSMAQQCLFNLKKREPTGRKKLIPGTPYTVLKYWLEKLLSNFLRSAIDISVYLKKSSIHTILSANSVGVI